jgi:hypothetical protein
LLAAEDLGDDDAAVRKQVDQLGAVGHQPAGPIPS